MKGSSAELADVQGSRAGSSSLPASPSSSHQTQAPPPKRTKISCFPCRTRKSKCDHARPCSSCVLRGTENQCTDPTAPAAAPAPATASASGGFHNASRSAPPPAQGHASGTATPNLTSASSSGALTASTSMPAGLDEYATRLSALENDRSNGFQPKKRRIEASSSRNQDASRFERQSSASRSGAGSDQDIIEEMQRMKEAMARIQDTLSRRASTAQTSSSAQPGAENSSSTRPSASVMQEYHIDPTQDAPGESDPPSRLSRQRWHHLRSVLPPLIDTHLMMHYVFVEADWLVYYIDAPRFIALWKHAYERQAISDVFAVQVLTLLGCSALFLSDNRKRAIHFAVPIRTLHTKLVKEAIQIVDNMPAMRAGRTEAETCDLIELMVNISLYFRCIGKEVLMARYTERAVSCCVKAGLDNELGPSWLGLTQAQVERRRSILIEVVMSTKWLAFHCRRDLQHLRVMSFNVGRPHLEHVGQLPSLEAWPQSDDVARTVAAHASDPANRFFAWRAKSDRERQVTHGFVLASSSIANEIPAIVRLVGKTESKLLHPEALIKCTKDEMRSMARETRQILARLNEWFTVILPKIGFGFELAVHANVTHADPIESKAMANNLMLNHSVFYMTSILCRAWLLLKDRLRSLDDVQSDPEDAYEQSTRVDQTFMAQLKQRSFDHAQYMHASWLPPTFLAEMEAAVIENGRRCIQSIPVIRAFQSYSSSQFYVGWACHSFLQAAVNLAIPLVRSHHRYHHQQPYSNNSNSNSGDHAGSASPDTDLMRQDIVTIFEAVSQLSDNVMARRTAQVLNRALRLSGIERPLAPNDEEDGIEDAWAAEDSVSTQAGQMQKAAEGLALLSAASSSRTPTDSSGTKYSGSDKSSPGVPPGPWESTSRTVAGHTQLVSSFTDVAAPTPYPAIAASSQAAASTSDDFLLREPMWWETRPPPESQQIPVGMNGSSGPAAGQHHMSDSQLLNELLNFDPSFWQFVLDGSGLNSISTTAAQTTTA